MKRQENFKNSKVKIGSSTKEMYKPRDQGVKIFENEALEVKIFDD
jgi:hypothetical protein